MSAAVKASLQEQVSQRSLLCVLEAVGVEAPDLLGEFIPDLEKLNESMDIEVRRMATSLLEICDGEKHGIERHYRSLAPNYRLGVEWGHIESVTRDSGPEPGRPLRDSEDPYTLVAPFTDEFKLLARETGLPLAGILGRAVELMRSMSNETALGERELRDTLNLSGLKFSYRRPRAKLARSALFRVVAELFDAGEIDLEAVIGLEPLLRHSDSGMLRISSLPRPPEIEPLLTGQFGSICSNFLVEYDCEPTLTFPSYIGEWVVLAERSKLQTLDWQLATQERRTMVTWSPDCLSIDGSNLEFPRVSHWYVREYRHRRDSPKDAIIVENRAERFDNFDAQWLALNPILGDRLGWNADGSGCFQWRDQDGRVAVKSVAWMDGGFHRHPPHPSDQVGSGWLVVASDLAVRTLVDATGPLYRRVAIRRSEHHDRETKERLWTGLDYVRLA
ncbi:hypothetical protein [uncultured Paludibaculum sp.]|uniref:hypothetical protein n=1 Tax=uncultured Paludibaculum sp. TaxID=1765020 RepID=UPI002AAB69D0|nr:hypothetical protein [uncultured Paludibaculum sp.]